MCMRASNGFADPTPTLVDIERTHILFVNSHFKPFAAIGYEYNKVRPNSGNPQYGGSVQFSIPQFGDFFNDMVVNTGLPVATTTAGTVPAFPPYIGADDQIGDATFQSSGTEDTVSGIYTNYTQEYVDISGAVQSVGDVAHNFVHYCEFVGQRLFKKVKFEVNGNPLDEYSCEAVNFHQKFCVGPHKMTGWKRLVGQEVPIDAYSDVVSITGESNYPDVVADLTDVNGAIAFGAPTSATETVRKYFRIVNGPQTPKATQAKLDLWVPLLFWFNKDSRLSVPSVSIPYGQRFISIELEESAKVLFTAPGNLFYRLTVEQQTSSGTGKGTAAAIAVEDVKRYTTLTPTKATGSVVSVDSQLKNVELYINNIFVNPEIHDIYIKRIGFSLIRVHRFQNTTISEESGEFLLSQLKWPIETIYIGFRPKYNVNASNPNQYRDWHHLTRLQDNVLESTSNSRGDVMIDDTLAFNAETEKHKTFSSQESAGRIVYPTYQETVDLVNLKAHSIVIFNNFSTTFFRDYQPYNFGGTNIVTPEDKGALMMNFCLYPGTYQPSGHMNISRAREFYIGWSSTYITASTPVDLIVHAIAINFILISDGSAVLRYST